MVIADAGYSNDCARAVYVACLAGAGKSGPEIIRISTVFGFVCMLIAPKFQS